MTSYQLRLAQIYPPAALDGRQRAPILSLSYVLTIQFNELIPDGLADLRGVRISPYPTQPVLDYALLHDQLDLLLGQHSAMSALPLGFSPGALEGASPSDLEPLVALAAPLYDDTSQSTIPGSLEHPGFNTTTDFNILNPSTSFDLRTAFAFPSFDQAAKPQPTGAPSPGLGRLLPY